MSSTSGSTSRNTRAWSAFEEIEKNEFNLNLPRYIDSQTPEDLQDIAGHLQGGIPAADVDALERYWAVCPQLRQHSVQATTAPATSISPWRSRPSSRAIYEHPEFAAFIAGMNAHFAAWRQKSAATLKALQAGCHPKEVIADLSEDLLAHYAGKPLIDPYDVYQHLMDYWAETMQDDCYLIAADGWKAETYRIIEKDKKGKEKDKGWTCDLIPKALIVARYFAKEQAAIDQLAAELESVTARLTEMEEEHGGEEGVFAELDKVNKANVAARLKEIKGDDGGEGRSRRAERLAEAQQPRRPTSRSASRTPRPRSTPRPTPSIRSSPRPRSRRWWWTTNGSPRSTPPSTARWTASASSSPSA